MATAPTVHHVDHEIWIMPLEWLAASDNTLKSKEHTDFIALGQLAQAIGKLRHQIKLLGMLGQAYVKVVKGKPYLIFKGTVNARPLQGTRYLRENPKVACFVIGTKELVKDALEATRIAVFAYVAIDVMKECLMDRFSLARLGINLS
ncbi:MAG TPA: hypothetical protein VL574_07015, partial [Stellaceae bacterium]|nr:hypothetical protein [Stellaceae bacterium]